MKGVIAEDVGGVDLAEMDGAITEVGGERVAEFEGAVELECGGEAEFFCGEEVDALNVGGCGDVDGGGDAVFGVAEVAAGLLGDAVEGGVEDGLSVPGGFVVGAGEGMGMVAVEGLVVEVGGDSLAPHGDGVVEEGAVVGEDGDSDGAFDHA